MQTILIAVRNSEHSLSKNQTAKFASKNHYLYLYKLSSNLLSNAQPKSPSTSPATSTSPLTHS